MLMQSLTNEPKVPPRLFGIQGPGLSNKKKSPVGQDGPAIRQLLGFKPDGHKAEAQIRWARCMSWQKNRYQNSSPQPKASDTTLAEVAGVGSVAGCKSRAKKASTRTAACAGMPR